MSLRSELKEAMAKAAELRGFYALAADIRAERTTQGVRCIEEDEAKAALSVCDEYEEVEVQKTPNRDILRLRSSLCWESHLPSFTVYRKKEKPEPTLEELARCVMKEWKRNKEPFGLCAAMNAFEKKLDE